MRDPRVDEALSWFYRCYEFDPDAGRWRRIALPGDGGVGVQDAWLIHGMEYVAGLQQDLLDDMRRRQRREHAVKRQRETRQRSG